jgi:iron complex transport system substrate-binding protein
MPVVIVITTVTICCGTRNNTGKKNSINSSKEIIARAQRFSIEKTDSCTILTITDPWQGAKGIKQVYFLVDSNKRIPHYADSSAVIRVPLEKIICMSTTHVAMVSALGEQDAIAGVSGAGYIYDETISERIREGHIHDVGYEAGINNELILRISPDLIMMYGIGSESAGYLSKINELGIKVIFNADYLETDPLGKAEWIKIFGALFCREERSDSIFRSICESYDQIKTYVKNNITAKPNVLLGLPFRDTWFISPGDSYASRFIEDAGGNYLWHDTRSSVSMPYSLEDVFLQSLKADYWLNTGNATSKKEISSLDPRLADLPCFIKGTVYNNNKRISQSGGNDYWESGILNPHLILRDIAAILHPDLFPDNDLYYYRKIE